LPRPPYYFRLSLSPPLTLNGKFFLDAARRVDLGESKLSLVSIDSAFPSPPSVSPQADGQFSMTGLLPGSYLVRLSGLPEDFYLKAARFEMADVLETTLDIEKQPKAPLQILLGSDGGSVETVVFDRTDHPLSGAQVVLVPDVARRHRPDQ